MSGRVLWEPCQHGAPATCPFNYECRGGRRVVVNYEAAFHRYRDTLLLAAGAVLHPRAWEDFKQAAWKAAVDAALGGGTTTEEGDGGGDDD